MNAVIKLDNIHDRLIKAPNIISLDNTRWIIDSLERRMPKEKTAHPAKNDFATMLSLSKGNLLIAKKIVSKNPGGLDLYGLCPCCTSADDEREKGSCDCYSVRRLDVRKRAMPG